MSHGRRLLIRDGKLADLIRNQTELPNITSWLGDRHRLQGVLGGGGNTPGAQQLRRIGRFLFANHVVSFRNRVKDLVREVCGGSQNEAHFHLCGTLAGGTGGGSIVDAAVQLRRLHPDTDKFKIYVYTLITADNAGQRDAGWFYPNQYAALKELNALASGVYRPHDLTGNGERIAVDAPITACVLVVISTAQTSKAQMWQTKNSSLVTGFSKGRLARKGASRLGLIKRGRWKT